MTSIHYAAGRTSPVVGLGKVWKAGFEWVAALLAVIVLAPVFLLIAALILIADGRPVFFGHRRVGRDGVVFSCLKFRTMAVDAEARLARVLDTDPDARREYARCRKLARDPRVFPLGRVLRRLSLDELPQFFNVLRGEMALVGPRPATPDEFPLYGPGALRYMSVRPGVTGPWQVSGRSALTFDDRIALDVAYAAQRSALGDISILMRTPGVVAKRTGAS